MEVVCFFLSKNPWVKNLFKQFFVWKTRNRMQLLPKPKASSPYRRNTAKTLTSQRQPPTPAAQAQAALLQLASWGPNPEDRGHKASHRSEDHPTEEAHPPREHHGSAQGKVGWVWGSSWWVEEGVVEQLQRARGSSIVKPSSSQAKKPWLSCLSNCRRLWSVRWRPPSWGKPRSVEVFGAEDAGFFPFRFAEKKT